MGFTDTRPPHARPFYDRRDAGVRLSASLHAYRGARPLVLGIPRGGVPVAYEIAKRLEGDLDVIVARKITAPDRPELALGAITADGARRINPKLRAWSTVSDEAIERIAEENLVLAKADESRFRMGLEPLDPAGRVVIVVDDGLATGATLGAVLSSLRQRGAELLLVAVPVGAAEVCDALAREVDGLICPHRERQFGSIADHYDNFAPVEGDEVERLLHRQRERGTGVWRGLRV